MILIVTKNRGGYGASGIDIEAFPLALLVRFSKTEQITIDTHLDKSFFLDILQGISITSKNQTC